jgi:trigger factor
VQAGDFITISYSATMGGEPLKAVLLESEGFIADNSEYMLKVDEGSFLPGFCAQLHGAAKGESRDVTVTMPAEGINEAVAGKEVVYHVTVADVKEAELPALDDEFAGRVFNGKTLEELRSVIRENLGHQVQQKDLEHKRIAAMMALRDKLEFELPPNVVHNATQSRVNQLVRMNIERGVTQEIIQENQEDIITAARDQAIVDVKDEYILMEIVDAEKLTVTQQDMVNRVNYMAMQNRVSPDKVVKSLQKNDGIDGLRHSILLGKALDVLVQHAAITCEGTAGLEDAAPQA